MTALCRATQKLLDLLRAHIQGFFPILKLIYSEKLGKKLTKRPLVVALLGVCSFIGGGAAAQEAPEVNILEMLFCDFPDTCHQDQCLTADSPMRLLFATLGEDQNVRVVALLPNEMGTLAAGFSGDMNGTRRLMFLRKPDVMPIRSMSVHKDGMALISLWRDDGNGSYTQGGSCKLLPPKNAESPDKS